MRIVSAFMKEKGRIAETVVDTKGTELLVAITTLSVYTAFRCKYCALYIRALK